MTRVCPVCRGRTAGVLEHGVAVDCPCGAELLAVMGIGGIYLRERVVDRPQLHIVPQQRRTA